RRLGEGAGAGLESFELVPRAALDLVLGHIPDTRPPLDPPRDWNALVELAAPEGAPAPGERLASLLGAAMEEGLLADAAIAASEAQAEQFWRLRESISEAEARAGPAAKHDISVPVAHMGAFIAQASAAVEAEFPGCRVIAFGHLGDGNIHFNVAAPEDADEGWMETRAPAVSRFVHDLVAAAEGSISAEHGIGQMKLAEFERLADPARLAMLRAVKDALDPGGIMNPGKLVPLAKPPAGP
ncbi:MAG: FAD-linked oxidase C-terminal domain-containing protein, partial [Sphingomonadaceae bacterium]